MNEMDFEFQERLLNTLVGGVSALDIPGLSIEEIGQAHSFLRSYGYDWENEEDKGRLWEIHRRAVTLIQEHLLEEGERLPEALTDQNELRDVGYLLIYASTDDHQRNVMQRSACAILRVMHVIVHLRNDLSRFFLNEIQSQILKPINEFVKSDPASGGTFLRDGSSESIKLYRFDVKPAKTSDSSIVKLLAKPNMVALNLLDTLGYRFVTKNVFDAFRVIRFLLKNNVVSFAHAIPDQSANTLYPLNIFNEFVQEMEKREKTPDSEEIEELLNQYLQEAEKRAEYKLKENIFSSKDYRFIKFISRKRVTIDQGEGKKLSFFYPYEVQVMDYNTHINSISGPGAHDKYKERQKKAARLRIFGLEKGESFLSEG